MTTGATTGSSATATSDAPSQRAAAEALDVLIVHHPTRSRSRPIMLKAVGLISLADHLDRSGIRAQVIHLGVEERVDPSFDLCDYVAATSARVVGISVHWFFQLPDSLELARAIKARHPHVLIVFGGFSASLFGAELLAAHPSVDAIVRGDAELPFLELCRRALASPRPDLASVPNLLYREAGGGGVRETPFSQVMDAALFATLRPTRMGLLKSHEVAFSLPFYPTQRFRDRFQFSAKGLITIAPTRGCAHTCPLCGGNRAGQLRSYNRRHLLFQPQDAVVATIREAMDYGYRNFYLCSDPIPDGRYYLELFRRFRAERLPIRFLFESWSLPSAEFVREFRDTFDQGLIILSPDSADEGVRHRTKGPLTYGNRDLHERLELIWELDLLSHVFFGFFLPGDTAETVRRTRRMAHDLENERSETFYLAFSTDPGSPVQEHPDEHDMVVEVRSLAQYLELLPRERSSPNLIAHRPRAIPEDEAAALVLMLNIDQLLHKVLPLSLRMLRTLAGDQPRGHALVEELLEVLVERVRAAGGIPTAGLLSAEAERYLGALSQREGGFRALADLARFEGYPYALMDTHFGGLGGHYTSACRPLALDAAGRESFAAQPGTVQAEARFGHDVFALASNLRAGEVPRAEPRSVLARFVIDRTAAYTVAPA